MRIRTIKPEFFKHDGLAELPPLSRLFFIGLWCVADRDGRLEDRPSRLKIEILPYDEVNADDILNDLARCGFIIRYSDGDMKVIQVVSFRRHQRITGKEAEIPSRFPEYNRETMVKHLGNTGESLVMTGREGKGKEGKGNAQVATPEPQLLLGDSESCATQPELPTPSGSACDDGENDESKPNQETAKDLIDKWHLRHLEVRGCKYAVQGAKDASNAKRLLQTTGLSASQIVDLAEKAWKLVGTQGSFYVKHAASIATFASHFNSIRQEVENLSKPNPGSTNGYLHRTKTEQVADERNKFISDTRSDETKAADEKAFWDRQNAHLARHRALQGR